MGPTVAHRLGALGIGLRCGSAVTATLHSSGLCGQWGQEPSPQLDPGCQRAGRLPHQGAVRRAAFPGRALLPGLGVHFPLLIVAVPVTRLPAQVESRQADPVLG